MCPLRIILIFLSATLAGFFVLRNLKSPSLQDDDDVVLDNKTDEPSNSVPFSSKVCSAVGKGFWTCVDMASGRYLWRNLVSAETKNNNE